MESTVAVQEGLDRNFRADNLNVYVYESRASMGKAAAAVIAAEIRRAIRERGRAVVILASAPSQNRVSSLCISMSTWGWMNKRRNRFAVS